MPSKLKRLQDEALRVSRWRGHHMTKFFRPVNEHGLFHQFYRSTCTECGMSVDVKTAPLPNEIDTTGEAIAMNCKKDIK